MAGHKNDLLKGFWTNAMDKEFLTSIKHVDVLKLGGTSSVWKIPRPDVIEISEAVLQYDLQAKKATFTSLEAKMQYVSLPIIVLQASGSYDRCLCITRS